MMSLAASLRGVCLALAVHGVALAESTQQTYQGYSTGIINNATVVGNGTGLDRSGKIVLESDGIRASFIPYGARLTNVKHPKCFFMKQSIHTNSFG
jgi:hypothetical protein